MQPSKEPLLAANTQIGRKVFSNRQVLKVIVVVDDQAFLVGQMQNTNKTVRCRNICQRLLGIDCLQAVDDVCEGERAIDGFGGRVFGGSVWWRRILNLVTQLVRMRDGVEMQLTYPFQADAIPQLILETFDINLLRDSCILHIFGSESPALRD